MVEAHHVLGRDKKCPVSTVGAFLFPHLQLMYPLTENLPKTWSRDITAEISRTPGV